MAEVAWWDFETLYPGGLTYSQLRNLILYLGRADGRFMPFSFYQVRANPVRWAIEIVDQVKKTIATASDFAKFKDTWPSPQNAESYDRLLEAQSRNFGSTFHWQQVHEALHLLESLYPVCGLVAVYGNLPTFTYSVLIYTPDQEMIPCESLDQLTNCLRSFLTTGRLPRITDATNEVEDIGRQVDQDHIQRGAETAFDSRRPHGDQFDPDTGEDTSDIDHENHVWPTPDDGQPLSSLKPGQRRGIRYNRFIDNGEGMSLLRDGRFVSSKELLEEMENK